MIIKIIKITAKQKKINKKKIQSATNKNISMFNLSAIFFNQILEKKKTKCK